MGHSEAEEGCPPRRDAPATCESSKSRPWSSWTSSGRPWRSTRHTLVGMLSILVILPGLCFFTFFFLVASMKKVQFYHANAGRLSLRFLLQCHLLNICCFCQTVQSNLRMPGSHLCPHLPCDSTFSLLGSIFICPKATEVTLVWGFSLKWVVPNPQPVPRPLFSRALPPA